MVYIYFITCWNIFKQTGYCTINLDDNGLDYPWIYDLDGLLNYVQFYEL